MMRKRLEADINDSCAREMRLLCPAAEGPKIAHITDRNVCVCAIALFKTFHVSATSAILIFLYPKASIPEGAQMWAQHIWQRCYCVITIFRYPPRLPA